MSDLPRPLRDPGLIERLREADAAYEQGDRTGSISVTWHYSEGDPRKVKVTTESESKVQQ